MKIAILGVSGMLGSMVLDYFAQTSSCQLMATVRSQELIQKMRINAPDVEWRLLDAEKCSSGDVSNVLSSAEWAINTIGVIKPYIHDDNAAEISRAIIVNSLFPQVLAQAAEQNNCRVLQIATDCVFSGARGKYVEKDSHDALDVYGKTKSLGEVFSAKVYNMRCSIIGPEIKTHSSLMDWFLRQPPNSSVNGYTNHLWNGVTTLHYAKLCSGIINNNLKMPHLQHIIPGDVISKVDLLRSFAHSYNRQEITITPAEAKVAVDRTLLTLDETLNKALWKAAGYDQPPLVNQMVAELSGFNRRILPL
jgi:dTDP-4-dehydrorhamnose reductase